MIKKRYSLAVVLLTSALFTSAAAEEGDQDFKLTGGSTEITYDKNGVPTGTATTIHCSGSGKTCKYDGTNWVAVQKK